jgi:hypothetical protein
MKILLKFYTPNSEKIMGSSQKKYFRYSQMGEWFNVLIENDFLRLENDTYFLNPPLRIIIEKKVVSSLKNRYKINREIGGILLAEPASIDSKKTLKVKGVRYVRNISDTPERSYRRSTSWNEYCKKCFIGTKKHKRYFPLGFHTHPRREDKLDILRTYFQMSTSDADRKTATERYRFSRNNGGIIFLALPSILCLVTFTNDVFLGVYGGEIAPDDFNKYAEKILGETISSIIDWGVKTDSFWGMMLSIFTGLGIGVFSTGLRTRNYTLKSFAMQLSIMRKQNQADNNYFTVVKQGDAVIDIPIF